jgi:Winged helix-turn helix
MVAAALSMTDEQGVELGRMAASSRLPHRQVVQARALLWAADGVANEEIARRCGVDSDAVRRWRSRFADVGVAGVGRIAKGGDESRVCRRARSSGCCRPPRTRCHLAGLRTGPLARWPCALGSVRTRWLGSGLTMA